MARNLIEGRGLTTDAIWSFGTPPLAFPRAAFEVWLPLPSLILAIPMALFGTTFAAAQLSSIVTGSIVAVLAWRLAADVAAARGFAPGRARTLALGAGLTAAVYLPLVLASVQPDSTMPFAAFVLAACLLITRLQRAATMRGLLGLGALIGLAALTRNEAIWLALAWAIIAWGLAGRRDVTRGRRPRPARRSVAAHGSGSSCRRRSSPSRVRAVGGPRLDRVRQPVPRPDADERAQPRRPRHLRVAEPPDARPLPRRGRSARSSSCAGPGRVHNVVYVLLFLGVPLSVLGLLGLPGIARPPRPVMTPHTQQVMTTRLTRRRPRRPPPTTRFGRSSCSP